MTAQDLRDYMFDAPRKSANDSQLKITVTREQIEGGPAPKKRMKKAQ